MHRVDGLRVVGVDNNVIRYDWNEVEQQDSCNVVPRVVLPSIDTFWRSVQ